MLKLHLSWCACCFKWVRNLVLQVNDVYKIEGCGEGCWKAYLYLRKTKKWRMEKISWWAASYSVFFTFDWLSGLACRAYSLSADKLWAIPEKKNHNILYVICDVSFRVIQPFDALHSVQLEKRRSINKDSFNDLNTYIFLYKQTLTQCIVRLTCKSIA
jgi:hypothetical protein